VQNVVKWVVNGGGIVVEAWLETAANRALETCHFFEIFLWISFGGSVEDRFLASGTLGHHVGYLCNYAS
jgi:hypothetical protein